MRHRDLVMNMHCSIGLLPQELRAASTTKGYEECWVKDFGGGGLVKVILPNSAEVWLDIRRLHRHM